MLNFQQQHLSDGNHDPIILSHEFNISPPPTPHTFAQFLWVFYNPYYGVYDVSIATWWNIEAYAAYWEMSNILFSRPRTPSIDTSSSTTTICHSLAYSLPSRKFSCC